MKAGRSSLRRRMLFTLLGCFVPMAAVISLLFVRSFLAQRQADIEALRYAAEDIRVTLDRFADGVYSVSDAFSTDERLIELLDRDYSADPIAKQYAVTYANNALFESYSRLIHQEKIAAIYLPARREVFDFRDPNQVTTLLVKQFEAMQVDASDKLGRFFFYPLQKNFLSTETYGEARRDMVVLGSRRVYSALKSGYPYVHIFAIEEQTLYEHYQYQARRLGAAVYVLTEEGALISSTDEAAVAAGQVPAEVTAAAAALDAGTGSVTLGGERYNAAASVCHSTDWKVLVLVPTRELLASSFSLYFQILGGVVLCLVVFAVLIWHFYRRFMAPLAQLEQAMRQADAGDLKAYVKPQGPAEVVRMMEGYNAMLDSLRVGIEQQMEMQRRRQDLEMQVLMSQINPHFLYNTLESIVWKAGEAGRPDIGARLRLYAGSSSCIKVQSRPHLGTRVTLELPWRGIS